MREENYVDGLLYELKNPELDANGQIVSSEIYAQAKNWNSYSDSSERMMNRICHHLNPDLIPDYSPLFEQFSTDSEQRQFVREIMFRAAKEI
jgi:hypothetical protein